MAESGREKSKQLERSASGGDITVRMDVRDQKGQQLELASAPVKVHFAQTSRRLTERKDR
jgi:hypothetical protein